MRKFTMFFMSSLICLCGCFTACSGNSDDNGKEPDNGEVTGPITLTVDKAKIEAIESWPQPKTVTQVINKAFLLRSEERRVGKECSEPCRSRWSPYH